VNEIHGSWFDGRNPVVKMHGTLRDDLCERMEQWSQRADLVLAAGTSLSGLYADAVPEGALERRKRGQGMGLVVVGLQKTRLTPGATMHIYARLDDAMGRLASRLGLSLPTDAEVAAASADPAAWYREQYREDDPAWTREGHEEMRRRCGYKNAKRRVAKAASARLYASPARPKEAAAGGEGGKPAPSKGPSWR